MNRYIQSANWLGSAFDGSLHHADAQNFGHPQFRLRQIWNLEASVRGGRLLQITASQESPAPTMPKSLPVRPACMQQHYSARIPTCVRPIHGVPTQPRTASSPPPQMGVSCSLYSLPLAGPKKRPPPQRPAPVDVSPTPRMICSP